MFLKFVLLALCFNAYGGEAVQDGSIESSGEFEDKAGLLSHLQILASDELAGREMGSDGSQKAQSYIIKTLKALKVPALNAHYQHTFIHTQAFTEHQGKNVIGLIPGSEFPQQYLVLSAHFDHLGKKGRAIYNGADDNASGTAALLGIAEQVIKSPMRYSLILLFTDGEELGLLGAHAFVKDHPQLISNIKLNINLDMIAGSSKTKKLRYISKDIDSLLDNEDLERLSRLRQTSAVTIKKGFNVSKRSRSVVRARGNWRASSDHYVFNQVGIPFLYFGVGTHKNYHTKNDDFLRINQEFYLKAVTAIYQELLFFDQFIKP